MKEERSSLAVTWSVWRALFLREVLTRISASRTAALWLIAEPALNIAFFILMYSFLRIRHVGGIDTAMWIAIGMTVFFTFRRVGNRAGGAIAGNRMLFNYRQVKPIDTILVRGFFEPVLMLAVALLLFSIIGLIGHDIVPKNPLYALQAFLTVSLLGLGYGMLIATSSHLYPETQKLFPFLERILYFTSGVIIPLGEIPVQYRTILMYNPVAHCLEAARIAFAPYYLGAPETSLDYAAFFGVSMLTFGLLFYRRNAIRLASL